MNKSAAELLICAGVLLIAGASCAFGQNPAAYKSTSEAMETIRKKNNLPALAGAVVTSAGIAQIAATGVRKAGTDIAVTTEDDWHLGSDTKAMTATMIGTLVDQGKLKWETTIGETYPELAASFPEDFRSITLKQLLSHRAGLTANLDWFALASSGDLKAQRLAAVRQAASAKLLSKPGAKYEYSNLGYVIAGAMAERVSGLSWEELMQQRILLPLGMHSAGFGGLGTPGKIDQPWGHGADGKPVAANGPNTDNALVMGPAGTVHCSLPDWAKFIADQLQGAEGKSALLKPETFKKLHAPAFGGDYAAGWIVTERPWGGGKVWTHSGSNTMNYATAWVAPERDFAVLVCTNQAGPAAQKGCDEAATALILERVEAASK